MKIKTSELTGTALDWAVAKCEGDKLFRARLGRPDDWDGAAYRAGDTSDERWVPRVQVANVGWFADYTYSPSTNWSQGGPIIERGHIHTWTDRKDAAYAGHPDSYWVAEMTEIGGIWWGPTPLIAAMRCYVANKLGDEIDIPKELT